MKQRLLSAVVVLACSLGVIASQAAPSMAEEMNYPASPLVPVSPPKTTGPSTNATPAGDTYRCNLAWVTIQADASGYAIGNCPQGTNIRRSTISSVYNNNIWFGGYVFGNFASCGFIQSDFLQSAFSSTENLCPGGPAKDSASFTIIDNNETEQDNIGGGCAWKPNADGVYRCTDGTVTTLTKECQLYGNVRPWLAGQNGTDPIRPLAAGSVVRWRYVSQYPNAANTEYWVAVRDMSHNVDGAGNWGFVGASCLPNPLPGDRWLG